MPRGMLYHSARCTVTAVRAYRQPTGFAPSCPTPHYHRRPPPLQCLRKLLRVATRWPAWCLRCRPFVHKHRPPRKRCVRCANRMRTVAGIRHFPNGMWPRQQPWSRCCWGLPQPGGTCGTVHNGSYLNPTMMSRRRYPPNSTRNRCPERWSRISWHHLQCFQSHPQRQRPLWKGMPLQRHQRHSPPIRTPLHLWMTGPRPPNSCRWNTAWRSHTMRITVCLRAWNR